MSGPTYTKGDGSKLQEKAMPRRPQLYCACGEKILSGKKCFDCKENVRLEREHAHRQRQREAREQARENA